MADSPRGSSRFFGCQKYIICYVLDAEFFFGSSFLNQLKLAILIIMHLIY